MSSRKMCCSEEKLNLPSDWSLRRLREISKINPSSIDKQTNRGEKDVKLCNYTDVYYNDRISDRLDFMDGSATNQEIDKHSLKRGDILITKDSEDPDDIGNPALVTEDLENTVCAYHLFHITPNEDLVLPEYLFWSLKSEFLSYQFRSVAKGVTRFGLTSQDTSNVLIPLPPHDLQERIAVSVDSRYKNIGALLHDERELLNLLEEKRQAVIREGVTGGHNSDSRKKPTKIPWLGYIPQSWQVGKVGWYFDVQLGKMLDSSKIKGDELEPYLRNKDVQWRDINTENLPKMDFNAADRMKYNLEKGDILVCEGGEIGRSAIVKDENPSYYYQKALHRVRPITESVSSEFFCYFMEFAANSGVFAAESNASTISHLTAEKLKDLKYPLPPAEEQKSIVGEITNKLRQLEQLQKKFRNHIELLEEYRQAIVDKAITGRLAKFYNQKISQ